MASIPQDIQSAHAQLLVGSGGLNMIQQVPSRSRPGHPSSPMVSHLEELFKLGPRGRVSLGFC